MKKTVIGVIIGIIVGAVAAWVLKPSAPGAAAPAAADAAAKPEVKKDNPLHVPPARRAANGIQLVKAEESSLAPEVQGYGRVLDASLLATLTAEVTTAQASLTASDKELARTKGLFAAGGNASAQAVEVAAAAAARDQANVASAETRLAAGWGREVAKHSQKITQALVEGAALVRIDLLPGDTPAADVTEVRLSLPGASERFEAEMIGIAPVADAQMTGSSYLVLLRNHPLPTGAALRVTVAGEGEAAKAFAIPRGAVVYHQGSPWVFVLGEEDTFERKLVSLAPRSANDTVAVTSGLEAGEQVVVAGAQQLLAAELQAGGASEEP
jgi:hypothetical protein